MEKAEYSCGYTLFEIEDGIHRAVFRGTVGSVLVEILE